MSSNRLPLALFGVCLVASQSSYAEVFFTAETVQKALYPHASRFEAKNLSLTPEQIKKIEDSSPTSTPIPTHLFEVFEGDRHVGYLVIDKVLGRHEFITYAVALNLAGEVQGIEVMEYLESYGQQIRNEKWRAQFAGKKKTDAIKLNGDIQNIAGATLSCKHITEGIRRMLMLYDVAIRKT